MIIAKMVFIDKLLLKTWENQICCKPLKIYNKWKLMGSKIEAL